MQKWKYTKESQKCLYISFQFNAHNQAIYVYIYTSDIYIESPTSIQANQPKVYKQIILFAVYSTYKYT